MRTKKSRKAAVRLLISSGFSGPVCFLLADVGIVRQGKRKVKKVDDSLHFNNLQERSKGRERSMQEEANMPSFKYPPSNMQTDMNLLLQLSDACMKRLSIDVPNYQASIAKNYLWISFVILSACVGFFFRAEMYVFVSDVFKPSLVNLPGVLCLFSYFLCMLAALRGFWYGMSVTMGSDYADGASGIGFYFNQAKEFGLDDRSSFEMKDCLLSDYEKYCSRAFVQGQRRGDYLRKIGANLRMAIASGLSSLLFYGVSCL